jgi:hypothetical protein
MKYEPIYRVAKQQFQNNLLNVLVGQVLLYHFFMDEPFSIMKSEYPELLNRQFSITDEMLSGHEFAKILCLNDNYAPAEDLRSRAVFLVQNYLEEKALDNEPELQEIYQRIVDDKPNSN